jgi:hypothetical protein
MICALLLFLPAPAVHAQEQGSAQSDTRTVTGRVLADETGEPLENVLVRLAVQGLQDLTDARGRFRIDGVRPILDTLVASYFAISQTRHAVDLSRPETLGVELRLAGTPPSPEEPEEAAAPAEPGEKAWIDCRSWLVEADNRADRPVEIYPWLGDPEADFDSLSESQRADDTGKLITVLAIGDRKGISLTALEPVLLLYSSRVTETASGMQRRQFVGWVTPEHQEIWRMQGLRIRLSCQEQE